MLVKGIDFNIRTNGELFGLPETFYTTFKATYTQGHKNDGTSLLAIQPFSAILGLGYQSRNDKWNLLFTGRYVAKKRTKGCNGYFSCKFFKIRC